MISGNATTVTASAGSENRHGRRGDPRKRAEFAGPARLIDHKTKCHQGEAERESECRCPDRQPTANHLRRRHFRLDKSGARPGQRGGHSCRRESRGSLRCSRVPVWQGEQACRQADVAAEAGRDDRAQEADP